MHNLKKKHFEMSKRVKLTQLPLGFFELPPGIQKKIFIDISFKDIVSLLHTNKAFNRWATNNDEIWQVIYERNFPYIPLMVVVRNLKVFYPDANPSMREITLSMFCYRYVLNVGEKIYLRHKDGTELVYTLFLIERRRWTNESILQPNTSNAQKEFLKNLPSTVFFEINDPSEFTISLRNSEKTIQSVFAEPYTVIYVLSKLLKMGFYISPTSAIPRKRLLKSCISCSAEPPKGKCSLCDKAYCGSCFEEHAKKEH